MTDSGSFESPGSVVVTEGSGEPAENGTETEAESPGVTVLRKPGRRWYLLLVGAAMILHGGGLLFDWPITVTVLELIYPGRESPAPETRDLGWALMFFVVGMLLFVWVPARLLIRRPVLKADTQGVQLALAGPFRRARSIPWNEVREVASVGISDPLGDAPGLLLTLTNPNRIGVDPWGARWVGPDTLCLMAQDWSIAPDHIVPRLEDHMHLDDSPEPSTLPGDLDRSLEEEESDLETEG